MGKKAGGQDPQAPDPEQAKPEAKAQRNFTDPESRIMVDGANKGSFIQAYNAQAAVDSQAQVVVAAEITQQANAQPATAADDRTGGSQHGSQAGSRQRRRWLLERSQRQ